ncbi:hypothetical protein PCANC_17333 [Puccinia coronata f. sp. avenae]|uniref:SAM domain-containing protein n=1 Tax=Puccinia coronata f. sp. avenae TaxID=200324 RepID=A0A2N5S395_9BASI|nr:hypothetical protein PCASD_26418 [Puccinia coronata f. sp. avenae]PLW41317.1 hypothetical protein PCANC_17333 [Puccinia coronata f. sp. avenae]
MLIPAQSSKIISSSARKNVLKDHHLPCPSLGFGTVLATTDIEPSIDIFHARLRPLNIYSPNILEFMRPSEEISQPMSTSSSFSNQVDADMTGGGSANLFNTVTPVSDWTEEDVKGWLQAVGFDELARVSEEQGIDGTVLIHLDSESLRDLGFKKVGQRLRLMRLINELLGLAEHYDMPDSNFKVMGEQMNSEYNLWNCVYNQNDRIRTLEDQVWNLNEATKFLRERTDSLSSFNTSWAMQSSSNSLALQSSKPSADGGNSTPPTTASSMRTAITCLTSNHHKAQDTASNEADSAVEPFTPTRFHDDATEHLADGMERFTLASPSQRLKKHALRRPSSPRNAINDSYNDTGSSSSNNKTPQPGVSPQSGSFSPNALLPKKSYTSKAPHNSQQATHNLAELRRKFSSPKTDEPVSQSNSPLTANGTVLTSARKPSLVTRRAGVPAQGQGISTYTMRNGGDNRSGGVWKPSSNTMTLSEFTLDQPSQSKSHLTSRPELNLLSATAISRSASASNLNLANSVDPKTNGTLKRVNTETSMRVKSHTDQTVIEVLSNHLSTFYVDEPHAWCKHVLLLRINDLKEYCLSYDDIPLKVYRSFKSREGVDFAIRSIDEIPSPLRLSANSRRKNLSFNLDEELLTPGSSNSGLEGESRRVEAETKPLAYGLAICGYQASAPGELTIKAGESFKLKSRSKGRYYLERESNSSLASPLSGTNTTPAASPTRMGNDSLTENVGWVAQGCILESTQSMRTVSTSGSSLKHLISSPVDGAARHFDIENMTTLKITLVAFQSQPMTWSGELNKVVQGEKIRVFNHKTRYHWVYCLRESSGERGWLPKWILSSNLDVFPDPTSSVSHSKLQNYLLQQSNARLAGTKSTESPCLEHTPNRKVVVLGRSASTASPQRRGNNKAGGSPTSLRSLRPHQSQLFSPAGLAISIETHLKQPITRNKLDNTVVTPEETTDLTVSSLTRSSTDVGSRTINFTPRSRRSRVSSKGD